MDVTQVINTKGAAKRLGCTETWIHKLVSAGKLRAYVYDDNGVLVEHKPEEKRQGQGLYFLVNDVDNYQTNALQRLRRSHHDPKQRFRTDIQIDARGSSTRGKSKPAK